MDDRILKDKKNNFTIATNESDNTIYMIAYQNDEMMIAYEDFGEMLFVDGTYQVNRNKYSLYFFSVKDAEEKALEFESMKHLEIIFNFLLLLLNLR